MAEAMRDFYRRNWITLIIICLMIFSVSCTGVEITPTSAPTVLTQSTFTAEPSNTPTSTVRAATVTPHPATPTLFPSATVLPTLSTEEVHAEVRELLQLGDKCKLPCFWDITPGKTRWEDAIVVMQRLASDFGKHEHPENKLTAGAWIDAPPEISSTEIILNVVAADGIIKIFEVRGIQYANSLLIPQFLESNGPPEEVWMHSFKSFPNNHPSVLLFLHYPSKGILATYYGDGEVVDGAVKACWAEAPNLTLWEPDRELSVEEAINITELPYIAEPIGQYRMLEEAAGIDIETFYASNAGSEDTVCLETPQNLWLDPFE